MENAAAALDSTATQPILDALLEFPSDCVADGVDCQHRSAEDTAEFPSIDVFEIIVIEFLLAVEFLPRSQQSERRRNCVDRERRTQGAVAVALPTLQATVEAVLVHRAARASGLVGAVVRAVLLRGEEVVLMRHDVM